MATSEMRACRGAYVYARLARRRGLTLIETALTTLIVGVAVTALVKLVMTTTQQDAWAQRNTAGVLLAENVREMMAGLPFADPANGTGTFGPESGEGSIDAYNDVDDFDGFDSASRPDVGMGQPVGVIDAARRVIVETVEGAARVPEEWANYRQQIAVEPVDPANLASVLPRTVANRQLVRITVTVSYRFGGGWEPVASLRWLKAR